VDSLREGDPATGHGGRVGQSTGSQQAALGAGGREPGSGPAPSPRPSWARPRFSLALTLSTAMNGQGQPFRAGPPAAVAVEYSCAGAPRSPRRLHLWLELTNPSPPPTLARTGPPARTHADCAASNEIKAREPIRCRECGCRVMYKKRIKRSASSLPRLALGRARRALFAASRLTSPPSLFARVPPRSGASCRPPLSLSTPRPDC